MNRNEGIEEKGVPIVKWVVSLAIAFAFVFLIAFGDFRIAAAAFFFVLAVWSVSHWWQSRKRSEN